MSNIGIDYGLGRTNIDHASGIRYGVIPANGAICQSWYDSAEMEPDEPTCPKCGNVARDYSDVESELFADGDAPDTWETAKHECSDFACERCEYIFGSESAYGDGPCAHTLNSDGIIAEQSPDSPDIFVTKSPYYTRAQFCSPCAPGACYLENPVADGPRAYCFPHSWFDDGRAPYPVYRVSDDTLVENADME